MRLLARRDHSEQELGQKLRAKGYSQESIQLVIKELQQSELINESRFAENYIAWRRQRGFGPVRIRLELKVRGIAAETIAELVDITDNAWFSEAHKVWQKHFRGQTASEYKIKAKQMRFLQMRGFTQEQIENLFHLSNDD